MAGSVNKVILVGNLGTDPEVRVLASGAKVARLNIATSETYTNKEGQRITNTEWHRVNVWRGLADVAEKYLTKGSSVYVEGRIRTRSYEDQNGVTKYATEIEADNMTMLGSARSEDQSGGGYQQSQPARPSQPAAQPSQQVQTSAPADDDDDLPF